MKEFNYFLALEAELEDSFNYIEPDSCNFGCYGAKYASLLNAVCIEFEATAKALINTVKSDASVGNIGEIKEQILSLFPNIEKNEVEISRIGQVIKPFEGWSNRQLDWWSSYTDLKHNRILNFHEANLGNILNAMSALLVLIVYLERFRDKERNVRTTKVFWMQAMPATIISEGNELPDSNIA
jgi:hypothetical protein